MDHALYLSIRLGPLHAPLQPALQHQARGLPLLGEGRATLCKGRARVRLAPTVWRRLRRPGIGLGRRHVWSAGLSKVDLER